MSSSANVQPESRTKKTLLNARVNLIFYFLTLALSFFSRKIFLDCLGAEFIGLTGTLQNLLGFLNLAELGIGSAIGYVLYKPLFEHDQNKICEIISVMGYLYRWIGLVILAGGCVLSCFLPLIFPETGFSLLLIYFAYFSFLASSLIGYFINYRQNLLGADQRNYVVTGYYQTMNIVKTIIQMVLVYYTRSFYLWIAIELTFGIIYSFILNWKINQTYPWLRSEIRQGKTLFKKYPEVMEKTKQLFVHKMAGFVQNQTTPFLIYSFVDLSTVAFYTNYTLILDKISALFSNVTNSNGAGIGNLIAEGNQHKIRSVFWELMTIQMFIASFSLFCIYHLINPFISLWLGDEFLLSHSVVILILCRCFIWMTRVPIDQFLFGYGLFYDIWAPITENLIYIFFAIVGGYFYGLPGVLTGGVVSYIVIVWCWKPIFLFWKGFKLPQRAYWLELFKYYILTAITMCVVTWLVNSFNLPSPSQSVFSWILNAIVLSVIFIIAYAIVLYIFTSGMKDFISRIRKKFIRI